MKGTYIFEWPCRLSEMIHVRFSCHLHYHDFDDLILNLTLTVWSCRDTEVSECFQYPYPYPCSYSYSYMCTFQHELSKISFHLSVITQHKYI